MLSASDCATINVAFDQAVSTICEADEFRISDHNVIMLGHDELMAELHRLRADGKAKNADLQRLLNLPSSRVSDIFATDRKPRKITLDEAKILVSHYGLDDSSPAVDEAPEPEAPNVENLMPLLDALIPLAPAGKASELSLRALSEALSYGLALLGNRASRPASADAIEVAARGAVARFREIGSA